MGTTGARARSAAARPGWSAGSAPARSLPVAVGLGVRDRAQAAEVAGFADGVIVGSAFVARMLAADDPATAVAQVSELATELAAGVRSRAAPGT